jgi:hypothetical protein
MEKRFLFSLFLMCVALKVEAQVEVSPIFYGLNFHSTYYADPAIYSDFSNQEWNYINETGGKMIRVGGKQYNLNTDRKPALPFRYVDVVDAIRAKGMEPIITVPFDGDMNQPSFSSQLDSAAKIVRSLNLVHKRNVKYFIIANEPDKDFPSLNSKQIAHYIRSFSSAMKAVDNSIKIIGPDLKTYYEEYGLANDLLSPPSSSYPNNTNDPSIMGKIPGSNLFHIDYHSCPR